MIPLNSNLSTLQRSGIRQFTNLAKTVPDCVMLTIGEPDFNTPEEIKAAVDYIVDPRLESQSTGKPSQIIKIGMGGEVEIIRP